MSGDHGDGRGSIPVGADGNSSTLKVLQNKQRHDRRRARIRPIMLAPEGTGRAHVRRPMRPSGVDEREGLSAVSPRRHPRLVRSRFASVATKLRRPGQADQASRPGLKSPGRSRTRQRPARRGPPSERVKNPRPEGFRITAPREALGLRRNGTQNCKSSGRGPGASHPSHQLSGFPREDERSCRETPSVGFADSSPRGGAAMRC